MIKGVIASYCNSNQIGSERGTRGRNSEKVMQMKGAEKIGEGGVWVHERAGRCRSREGEGGWNQDNNGQ